MLRKIRAAICDEEELYCSRLAEYLQANQSEMVEACVCSQKKELKKLLLESGVDVVLMTEDFFAPDILSYGGVVFWRFWAMKWYRRNTGNIHVF